MSDRSSHYIYTFFPTTSPETTKILSNLGRATKRGIKKCPKCGIFNGTRGLICKNKLCDAVFKGYADKRKVNLDAVRLGGIVRQVYSVRVRDRGPDHRGFVQLPLLSNQDKSILSENALCFVDSCQRLFDDSILKCHELDQDNSSLLCTHIESAVRSENMAVPLEFNRDVLDSLKLSKEMKRKLWVLLSEKEGPLVQRVSRTVMVVKCQVSPKHPLGYLHFSFGSTKGRGIYDKYYCSCTEFMSVAAKCIHYYACICALASDAKFSQEFMHLINLELGRNQDPFLSRNLKRRDQTTKLKVDRIPRSKTHKIRPHHKKYKKLVPNIYPVEIKVLEDINNTPGAICWKFEEWLIYATESINQTMHFENCGTLNTLLFSIPESFYEEFHKRIPTVYEENDGTFRVMSILHLKEIFDTAEVKLKISKKFIHDNQKGYVEYEDHDNVSCPASFIFFLNVGQSTVDESDNTNNPFLIEWVSSIYGVSKVGQLKFQYKYGRKNTT